MTSGQSPFQQAALNFALNNSPGGAFKAFLSRNQENKSTNDNSRMLISDPLFTLAPSVSSSMQPTFDGIFRVPELPLRRFNGCNFCGSLTSQKDNGPLMQCDGCKTTLYCSQEHRNFDLKRHKMMCKTFQMRVNRSSVSLPSDSSDGPIKPTAIRPSLDQSMHAYLPNSTSNSSINSFGDASSGYSEVSVMTGASNSSMSSSGNHSMDSTLADPDIQIIESNNFVRNPRKRALDASENCSDSSKVWKDHSKNLLFKTSLQDHIKALAASGMALNQHQAIALRLRYIGEHVIRSLNEYGWAVVDNFLGKTHCKHTYMEVERLYERGLFKEGQLIDRKDSNDMPSNTATKDVRSDKIYWFDSSDRKASDAVTIRLLVSMIDSVIVHFANRIPPYTIGGRSRAMLACYPGSGTRYVKHVDNPIRDGRCITSIYYCNEDWMLAEDGGTLRLYPESSQVPMDIDPQADRLVFFWSDHRNPHEVLPVFRPRYAITIWYFDQTEKLEALERRKNEEENCQNNEILHANSRSPPNNINLAPIPQKPESPRVISSYLNLQQAQSHLPTPMQWRRTNQIVEEDRQSNSTRSMLDEEEEDNSVIDVENTNQKSGIYVPNFEV